MRRFYCLNPTCRRRTFAETPTDLLTPRARRTRRLGEAQATVGIACGGAGGARLLAHLHMPASRATVLRLVTRMPMPDTPAPIRVGIDDWAMRKGSRYSTIVVDLDRHLVIIAAALAQDDAEAARQQCGQADEGIIVDRSDAFQGHGAGSAAPPTHRSAPAGSHR